MTKLQQQAADRLQTAKERVADADSADATTSFRAARLMIAYIVLGNDGYDVISDYSVDIEPLLAGANNLAERLEK